ncbi:ragulator complex protein LAMTOR1 [Tachysurus vachellii]|uniref:ragulator complex protein LAMTOR1 n=1 Tax=Tachysurus vachellii TaxID=175792 RepID=UPI00296AB63A|nr:ragulator complex protein LAMTOR1 [Tachysurus vachellii]
MGCCYSNESETPEQDGDERKPLIPHPNPDSKPPNGTERNPANISSTRTDEQALLSIINKTAQNIIDVSAADSQGMEQHEYMDKARQYSTKLALLSSTLSQKKPPPLPSLTSQPHQVLASDLVPNSDIQQVCKVAAYAYSAISQIKVDAKEELVVQFAIP